jgi:anti-sigma B factor antagonist
LDTYNSSDFFRIIHRFLELEKRLVLVLDISKVNYMSSTGIGSCVEINRHCLKNNIKLYIKGMQKNVEEVFQLLGFYGFFNYIDELNDIKEEKIKRSLFPANIQCPYCSKKLKAQKTGSFKCPECLSAFRIVEANSRNKNRKTGVNMKISTAFDNLAKFFGEDDEERAPIPSEVFRDDNGRITEIRLYNAEYEEMIVINRRGEVEALSVEEFEDFIK